MKSWLRMLVLAGILVAPLVVSAAPPAIRMVADNNPAIPTCGFGPLGRDWVEGSRMEFVAQANPGGKMTIDIGPRTIQMYEEPPGMYRAVYTITAADHFRNQSVIFHLTMPNKPVFTRACEQTVTVVTKVVLERVELNLNGPAKLGDTVTITAHGTTRCHASADVGGTTVALRETSEGIYSGSFQVTAAIRSGSHIQVTLTQGTQTVNKDSNSVYVESAH